jgi:hypothetical protein
LILPCNSETWTLAKSNESKIQAKSKQNPSKEYDIFKKYWRENKKGQNYKLFFKEETTILNLLTDSEDNDYNGLVIQIKDRTRVPRRVLKLKWKGKWPMGQPSTGTHREERKLLISNKLFTVFTELLP